MKRMLYLVASALLLISSGCVYFFPTTTAITAASGLEAGVPSLPYYTFSKEELLKLNTKMREYNVPVTLADTFKTVYGMKLEDFNPSGYNEQVFTNMTEANQSFHKILKSKNIPNADHYLITTIDSAREQGLMLMAAVFRPVLKITVPDKYDSSIIRILTPDNPKFYRPYQTDLLGNKLDTVYEWAALPTDSYNRQSRQAVLLTLTANEVINNEPNPDYWEKEEKWIAGEHMAVAAEQDEAYCEFLGVEKGFTCD